MSDALNDARRLRQELGELWPRLQLAEARLAEVEAERDQWHADYSRVVAAGEVITARVAELVTLLREIREDAVHFGMPTTRIDAFLKALEVGK